MNHASEGFNPAVPDPRGYPANPNCDLNDTDGDGLSTCAEQYLGTDVGIVDSDSDGIPDGLEVRYGFDPLHHDDFAHQDTDGDGISDLDEFRANTDPTVAGRATLRNRRLPVFGSGYRPTRQLGLLRHHHHQPEALRDSVTNRFRRLQSLQDLVR